MLSKYSLFFSFQDDLRWIFELPLGFLETQVSLASESLKITTKRHTQFPGKPPAYQKTNINIKYNINSEHNAKNYVAIGPALVQNSKFNHPMSGIQTRDF